MSKATLPALATELREAFPELAGRVVSVADAQIDKDNLPSLPVCLLVLNKAVPVKDRNTPRKPAIEEHFVIEFWFPPQRYTQDGKDTPYWAFYDYDTLQERLFTVTSNWVSPRNSQLIWKSFTVDANQYAVAITFQFTHSFFHCDYEPPEDCKPELQDDGFPFKATFVMKPHPDPCCDDCGEPLIPGCGHDCKSAMDEHHARREEEGFP